MRQIHNNDTPMARPKMRRMVDGIALADNLYLDWRKKPGKYRYLRPDGSAKTFHAASVTEANDIAAEANALRDTDLPALRAHLPGRAQLGYHLPVYLLYRQRLDHELVQKRSWDNRRYALQLLAEHLADIPLGKLSVAPLRIWWDTLTYHQQKLRFAECRRFFNWLAQEGLTPRLEHNPFTSRDDLPRLQLKTKPQKTRLPLPHPAYLAIHAAAHDYPGLQIAMEISLYTTLREGDICGLTFADHVINNRLRVVVSKSAHQKGAARATRLEWDLSKHPALAAIINRARELSMLNRRCPYLISHRHKRRIHSKNKTHLFQVTPDRLSRMFRECRDATHLFDSIPTGRNGPSFHEIRGLSSAMLRSHGHDMKKIQQLMAHESVATTLGYQDHHDLPHVDIDIALPAHLLAG